MILCAPPALRAQQSGEQKAETIATALTGRAMIIQMRTGETHLPGHQVAREGRLSRWLRLETASVSSRYRFAEDSRGTTTAAQLQHQQAFRASFRFDAQGRYSIHAGLFTGNALTASWNNTGWGTGRARTSLYLKHLYLSLQPARGVEIQYGGLEVLHGESTDITSYDYGVYLTGQRLSLKRPDRLWVDEISVTSAWLGDANTPGISRRFHRLRQANYHQLHVNRKFGNRVRASAEYTIDSGVDTLRQAVTVQLPSLRVIDSLHFENYQRPGRDAGYGFGIYGQRRLHRRFTLGGGYTSVDRGMLNADRFGPGRRLYLTTHFTISPEFSVTTYVTRALRNTQPVPTRTRLDLVFSYNLIPRLRKSGLF